MLEEGLDIVALKNRFAKKQLLNKKLEYFCRIKNQKHGKYRFDWKICKCRIVINLF
jgi:hypothetical protein